MLARCGRLAAGACSMRGPGIAMLGGGIRSLLIFGGSSGLRDSLPSLTSQSITGIRGMASKKEVTWYGARRSLDPTAPSVIRRRPTTPSQRSTAIVDKTLLYRGPPAKALTVGLRSKGGRNNQGKMTVRGQGGGNKRKYRIIDFKRATAENPNVVGTVDRIEYDPNRSAFIALLKHPVSVETDDPNIKRPLSATMSYIICPRGIQVGQQLYANRDAAIDIQVGNAMPLRYIPVGTLVHNIEMHPGKGGEFCRSAGTSAQVLERDDVKGLALLRMQSKEVRYVLINCMATIGEVSNPEHKNEVWGKAGRSRWYGIRPTVRGVAQNPVDHPHGGGEGKKHAGRHPVTKWGKPCKGTKTVRKLSPLIRTPRWKVKAQKKGT